MILSSPPSFSSEVEVSLLSLQGKAGAFHQSHVKLHWLTAL